MLTRRTIGRTQSNVFFCPGNGGGISSSSTPPAVPTSFTDIFSSFALSWHQTWHSFPQQLSVMQRPVCTVCGGPGLHGEQGGSPKQIPQEASALENSRVDAES